MSSGSYLTIFRKHNVKINDDEFKQLVNCYTEMHKDISKMYNKIHIPLILNSSILKSQTNDNTISVEDRYKKYQYILSTDKSCLDNLLIWHFDSTFTCLKDEFDLNRCPAVDESNYIIDVDTAKWMLQACSYLLNSSVWSNETEDILNNKWIDILATGNINSYLKYTRRNSTDCDKDYFNQESNSEIEYNLKRLKLILDVFISAKEEKDYIDSTELLLVYSVY